MSHGQYQTPDSWYKDRSVRDECINYRAHINVDLLLKLVHTDYIFVQMKQMSLQL